MSDVVNKLWGFCHTLRHDGIDYGDYIEQLTYLMFLKMSHEKGIDLSKIEYEDNKKMVKLDCSWSPFTEKSGQELLDAFAQILRALRVTSVRSSWRYIHTGYAPLYQSGEPEKSH